MIYECLIVIKDYLMTLYYYYCTRKKEKLYFEEAELARLNQILNYYREEKKVR